MRKRLTSNEKRAQASKWLHLSLAFGWTCMVPITFVTGLENSLPFIVIMSIYALIIGHVSAAAGKSAKQEVASNGTNTTSIDNGS